MGPWVTADGAGQDAAQRRSLLLQLSRHRRHLWFESLGREADTPIGCGAVPLRLTAELEWTGRPSMPGTEHRFSPLD